MRTTITRQPRLLETTLRLVCGQQVVTRDLWLGRSIGRQFLNRHFRPVHSLLERSLHEIFGLGVEIIVDSETNLRAYRLGRRN